MLCMREKSCLCRESNTGLPARSPSLYLLNNKNYNNVLVVFGSLDRSVDIAMGYMLDDRGSIPGRGKLFCIPQFPDRFGGPPSLLSNGYQGVERPGREVDNPPLSSAEVKNVGALPSLPHTSS
jgi:hypothetical protein